MSKCLPVPLGCENLLWLLCASHPLHLNLLPQFNRQQRKKGRGRELQSVSQPTQRDVTLLCHSGRKYKPARLGNNQTRPHKRVVVSFGSGG